MTDPTRPDRAPTSWPSGWAAPATCATTPWRPWGSWPPSCDRPLLLEGEPGTGKTALAEALAESLACR